MRIGIEAIGYFREAESVKRVTVNLVDNIISLDHENEYVIFLSKEDRNKKFNIPSGAKIKLVYVSAGNLKFNFFYKLFVFPFYTYIERIDFMLYQVFPPFLGKSKKAVLIYDILYLDFPELFPSKERLYLRLVKKFFTKKTNIITISNSEKERCLRHQYTGDSTRIGVFHLAASPKFQPLNKHSAESIKQVKLKYKIESDFILFVGLLSARKNLDNLLRAINLMDSQVSLVIVGEPNHLSVQSGHHALVKELGIESKIHYTGFINDDDLFVLYALAKVFCFPSFAEGFGLPPLESMASAVPVAVSNNTSIPEVCGEAGTYFDPESPQDIANALTKLLTDKIYYEQKKGLSIDQSIKFSWRNSASQVINHLTRWSNS